MFFYYLFIFMVGSLLGYFLELFYRKIKFKKWIKPGVFYGVYLPLYGLGLCTIYFVYSMKINLILQLLMLLVLLTFIELLCGVIFIKYFKIPLWNYCENRFNYKGLICLKFSFYWVMIGFVFVKVIFPFIELGVFINRDVILFMYLFYMFFVSDVLYRLFYLFYLKIIKQS